MPEHDALVLSYRHLAQMPRANEALHTLKKVASLVKPIMRARNWKVKELSEFYPSQTNLLGLNVNRGQQICLRLRYPGDRTQFMPIESVVDTMLHELCHNVIGPHNAQFHELWDQLRDEHQGLLMKGYTGEGFLSEGRRLGGARVPPHEARRIAQEAAEKRRARPIGTTPASEAGRRLGGARPAPGEDIRRVIVDAVERRNKTLQGCGTERLDDSQVRDISDSATRNGFRTQAEEDEANEAAIAQALWDLVQEDEKAKLGKSYITPSPANPAGSNIGATTLPGESSRAGASALNPVSSQTTFRNSTADEWTCQVCTLRNPTQFLCCSVCGVERSLDSKDKVLAQQRATSVSSASRTTSSSSSKQKPDRANHEPVLIDLTESPPRDRGLQKLKTAGQAGAPSATPPTWQCSFCGRIMERQWWACATCGNVKESSR